MKRFIPPRWLWPLVAAAGLASAEPQAAAPQTLAQMVSGYRTTQMIHVATKLDLASKLRQGALPIGDLARQTGTQPEPLYRLMRALAGLGLFREETGQQFALAPAGQQLLPDAPGSVYREALVAGEPFMWQSWGNLLHSVRTGETAFDHVFGKQTFAWFREHPAEARLFDEFQAENTRASSASVVRAYDFSVAKRVVDVGGGNGQLLSDVLDQFPSIQGVLFDLQHVVDAAKAKPLPHLGSRCEFAGGDFFQSVPGPADLYTLKYIIHDWDDEQSLRILKNVGKAMAPGSKLLLIEDMVCGPNQPCRAKVSDLTMLVRTGGRNRTEAEYRVLLSRAGFAVTRVIPVQADLKILEAEKERSLP